MKKYLGAILAISAIISAFALPAVAQTVGTKIFVTDFSFVQTSGSVTASCYIEKINNNDAGQEYVFFTVAVKNGRIISRDKKQGTLYNGDKPYLETTVSAPSEASVISYFWKSISSAIPIAPKAVFGSDNCELTSLYVDGKKVSSFDGQNGELVLPASCSHIPQIKATAADSSANIQIDEITDLPQMVNIKVTSSSGKKKTAVLSLKLSDGEITDGYTFDKDGKIVPIITDIIRNPYYGLNDDGTEIHPGDSGFSFVNTYPEKKTYTFSDRNFYYYQIPDVLIGAAAVQTPLQLIRYDENFLNKDNCLKNMAQFDINRSADVYIFGADNMNWLSEKGYKRDASMQISIINGFEKPAEFTAFKKTFVVNEDEKQTVYLGNNKSSDGVQDFGYFAAVVCKTPAQTAGIKNVTIEEMGDFVFNPDVYSYTIYLPKGVTKIPDISYGVTGLGAQVTEEKAVSLPGTSKLSIKSGDGNMQKIYSFAFEPYDLHLSDLKVDGQTISDFEKTKTEYIYKLPYGKNTIPEVSAFAPSYAQLDIKQATTEDKTAVITLKYNGDEIVYKVTFEETLERPSTLTELSLRWSGILKRAYSASPQADTVFSYNSALADPGIFYADAFNLNGERVGYSPVVAFMQLDFSKLANIDESKKVELCFNGIFSAYDAGTTGTTGADVSLYPADDFEWSSPSISDVKGNAAIEAATSGITPFSTARINTGSGVFYNFDITDYAMECIKSGNTLKTFAIYVNPVLFDGNNNRLSLRVFYQTGTQSKVTYYKY